MTCGENGKNKGSLHVLFSRWSWDSLNLLQGHLAPFANRVRKLVGGLSDPALKKSKHGAEKKSE